MKNQEKRKAWLIFFTSAVIAASFLSLQIITELPVALILFIIHLTNDIVISKLIVLFITR